MRKDAGVDGDAQRISQLGWMLFLKIFDEMEEEWETIKDNYKSPIRKDLRWREWAADEEGMTGDELLDGVGGYAGGRRDALDGEDAIRVIVGVRLFREVDKDGVATASGGRRGGGGGGRHGSGRRGVCRGRRGDRPCDPAALQGDLREDDGEQRHHDDGGYQPKGAHPGARWSRRPWLRYPVNKRWIIIWGAVGVYRHATISFAGNVR